METTKNIHSEFDEIMFQVGNSGKFQKKFNILFNFVFTSCATLAGFNIILAVAVPEHWCFLSGRELTNFSTEIWKEAYIPRVENGGQFSQCEMYNVTSDFLGNKRKAGCVYGWEYDKTYYTQTISSQENWVCDEEVNIANLLVFGRIGEIVGTFIFSPLGDKYGRRPVFYVSVILTLIGKLGFLFSKGVYTFYVISIIVSSLPGLAMYTCTLVIGLEISSIEDRTFISLLQNSGFTTGLCIAPLLFWAVGGDWIPFTLVSTLPLVPFLFLQKYMIESPRWLASRNKTKRCNKQLKKIAKANNSELTDKMLLSINKETKIVTDEQEEGPLNLFSSWNLAKKTLHVVIGWVTFICVYTILILNVSNLKGNPFLNFFWQGLAEIPGYFVGKYLSDTLGRRLTKVFSYFTMGLTLLIISYFLSFSGPELIISICGIFLKGLTSIVFYSLQLHTLEIYPTCLRQTGSAVGYFVASIFSIFVPYVIYWGTISSPSYPYLFCAILSVIGGVSSFFLPETLNKKLPETVKEAETFGNDQKLWELPRR